MPTFSTLAALCLLLAVPSLSGAASTVPDFIKSKNAKDGTIAKIMDAKESQNVCFVTGTYLVCVSSDKQNGNPDIDSRLPRLLEARARNNMYRHLIFKTDRVQFKHKEIYYNVCTQASSNDGRYLPSGIESASSIANGFVYSAISIPYQKSLDEFYGRSRSFGKEDYCKALLENAQSLEKQGNHSEAISCLHELLSMKTDSKQGYILLSRCLLASSQKDEALKYARYSFENFNDSLSSKDLEELGEMFIALQAKEEAVKAFELASSRYDGK